MVLGITVSLGYAIHNPADLSFLSLSDEYIKLNELN